MATSSFNNPNMVAQSSTNLTFDGNNIGSIIKFNNGLKLMNIATGTVITAATTSISIPSGYHATSGNSYPFLGANLSTQPRYATLVSGGDTLTIYASSTTGFYGYVWYY